MSSETPSEKRKSEKKQWVLFVAGLIAMAAGIAIIVFFGGRKVFREYQKFRLMQENPVIEIAELGIKAPVLEGTDSATIARAAGHFTGTGAPGEGNYCIAAHSSTIYKEYFNGLKNAGNGMKIKLLDRQKNSYDYTVCDSFIVDPADTWVLDDKGDSRITLITCTDDGSQRRVVVGKLDE